LVFWGLTWAGGRYAISKPWPRLCARLCASNIPGRRSKCQFSLFKLIVKGVKPLFRPHVQSNGLTPSTEKNLTTDKAGWHGWKTRNSSSSFIQSYPWLKLCAFGGCPPAGKEFDHGFTRINTDKAGRDFLTAKYTKHAKSRF
jgi:hypothetical protein